MTQAEAVISTSGRERYQVPDGIEEIRASLPTFVNLIAETARWVHPSTFRALPVWYPEAARGTPLYNAAWNAPRRNKQRGNDVTEANILAGKALTAAMGTRKTKNWTVCHIWGRDDPAFQLRNDVVRDPRYYSCVANMIWLPTPLKGFTDVVPEIKVMLRLCAYFTYEWVCEHESVKAEAERITSMPIPAGYPAAWPQRPGGPLPRGTAPFTSRIEASIAGRKRKIRRLLERSEALVPRQQIHDVLKFWGVQV